MALEKHSGLSERGSTEDSLASLLAGTLLLEAVKRAYLSLFVLSSLSVRSDKLASSF